MMFKSLKVQLALAMVGLAVGSIFSVGLLVNGTLTTRFESYLRASLEERSRSMAESLGRSFETRGDWDPGLLMNLTHLAMSEGLTLELTSPAGSPIWRMGGMMDMAQPFSAAGQGIAVSQSVTAGERGVGVLTLRTVGAGGPFSYLEQSFLDDLNRSILLSGLGVGGLALAAGFMLAGGIARPLASITAAARRIKSGDLAARVGETGPNEVRELAASINHLAEGLSTQEKLRRRLTADVAHELRTPLATMQSHVEAFIDGVWEATPERLGICYDELLRLTRLVGDLERLAEAEAENRLELAETLAGTLLSQAAGSFEASFQAKGVRLRVEPVDPSLSLRADPDKLLRILGNLLSNALKYTPAGGEVGLSVRSEGDRVVFEVSDTGPGIPEGEMPFIFERFYRGDPSRTRSTGGAGLGLAIVLALARTHGGTVEVSSRVGAGSRFRVILPGR